MEQSKSIVTKRTVIVHRPRGHRPRIRCGQFWFSRKMQCLAFFECDFKAIENFRLEKQRVLALLILWIILLLKSFLFDWYIFSLEKCSVWQIYSMKYNVFWFYCFFACFPGKAILGTQRHFSRNSKFSIFGCKSLLFCTFFFFAPLARRF